MKLAMLFVTLMACNPRHELPAVWNGVPGGTALTCGATSNQSTVFSCVGGGAAYQCIERRKANDKYVWWQYECARVGILPTAEEPPSDNQ